MKNKLLLMVMVAIMSFSAPIFASEKAVSEVEKTVSIEKSTELNIDDKDKNNSIVDENKEKEKEKPQTTWVKNQNKMEYNQLIKNVEDGNVKLVIFSENLNDFNNIMLELNNGYRYRATLLQKAPFISLIESKHIKFELVEDFSKLESEQIKQENNFFIKSFNYISYYSNIVFAEILNLGGSILRMLIIFGILYYILFKVIMMKGGTSSKKIDPKDIEVSFSDIAGNEAAKNDIKETIDFFNDDNEYKKYGVVIPSGVLLTGPPGNGKTMFAKAIAKECNADFYSASGSEFEEMFAGLGAKRVRSLFAEARKSKKAVIFIDELDSIGKKRGGINSYHEQTLNQLLIEIDGFNSKSKDSKVLVVAATNRLDVLDEAIIRPGRFDRQLVIGKPAKKDRIEIMKKYIDKSLEKSNNAFKVENLDYEAMGALTSGFSGAELKHLIDEALMLMIREKKEIFDKTIFMKAKDKVMLGNQRKDLELVEEEKRITAYHELGHAFVSMRAAKGNRIVEGISIIPHEKALGVTFQTEIRDSVLRSKEEILNDLRVLLGGRAAENVFIGSITTGASNDLERANMIAYEMIARYGMSSTMPMLNVSHYAQNLSEGTKSAIEREISDLLSRLYEEIQNEMKENKDFFNEAANILLDKEVINKEEFVELCKKYEI